MKTSDFPMAIYRRGSKPGQIDHPGWLSTVVPDQAALDAALADGWQIEMRDVPAATGGQKPEGRYDGLGNDLDDLRMAPRPRRGWTRKD